jgi:hypothetical protein
LHGLDTGQDEGNIIGIQYEPGFLITAFLIGPHVVFQRTFLSMASYYLGSHRQLKQASAMGLPLIIL